MARKVIPTTELAWAAGFYDGEGSMGTYPQSTRRAWYTRMTVGQKDPRPLYRFQEAVGGAGTVLPDKSRDMHYWKLTSLPNIRKVVEMLWPYLCEQKRRQASWALGARFQNQLNRLSNPMPRARRKAAV